MSFGERYLTFPDLFPARLSGERCGDASVTLDCAGGPYRVRGLSQAQADALSRRFDGFLRAPTEPALGVVDVQVFAAAADDFEFRPEPGAPYSFDCEGDDTTVKLAGREFMARLERRPGLTAGIWTSRDHTFITYGDFENIFRVLIAQRLLDLGGILLHSSGVIVDGGAHLFVGYSGAGKTTIARLGLADGYGVLSDDINLVTLGDGEPRAARSPFAGELGPTHVTASSYPLHGIYLLEQGEDNALSPITPARAVADLAARAPFSNQDPYRAAKLMDNLSVLVESTPVSRLRFRRAGGFWQHLHTGNATS